MLVAVCFWLFVACTVAQPIDFGPQIYVDPVPTPTGNWNNTIIVYQTTPIPTCAHYINIGALMTYVHRFHFSTCAVKVKKTLHAVLPFEPPFVVI
jgi:hypothetical protein